MSSNIHLHDLNALKSRHMGRWLVWLADQRRQAAAQLSIHRSSDLSSDRDLHEPVHSI